MIGRFRHRRPSGWFLAAGLFTLLAVVASLRALGGGGTVPVLVAGRDLPAGASLESAGAVRVATLPAGARLPGMLREAGELAGRRPVAPVAEGEPLTDAGLGGRPDAIAGPLRTGERAVSVPAGAVGAAFPVVVPGTRVDVLATTDGGRAEVVVEDAEVIVQFREGSDDLRDEGGAILLRVSAPDALRLTAALDRAAGVRVVPRPFGDPAVPAP